MNDNNRLTTISWLNESFNLDETIVTTAPVSGPWPWTEVPAEVRISRDQPRHGACTVLYCTVLYCTVLYCTILYCTVLTMTRGSGGGAGIAWPALSRCLARTATPLQPELGQCYTKSWDYGKMMTLWSCREKIGTLQARLWVFNCV